MILYNRPFEVGTSDLVLSVACLVSVSGLFSPVWERAVHSVYRFIYLYYVYLLFLVASYLGIAFASVVRITKTSPCNDHPLTPHFYIVKLGFTGVFIFFLFLL